MTCPQFKKQRIMKECGYPSPTKPRHLYFPFFLMGGCGVEECVISWNGERESLKKPKKMDYNWFKIVGQKISANPYFDWDWNSFKNNILLPNREHIKSVNDFDDARVDLLLRDGYVFLDNWDKEHSDDYTEEELEQMGAFPNLKNLFDMSVNKWEY